MTAGSETSPVFDFTSLDFASMTTDLERFAQTRFPDEAWTDFNESNFGTFLLELNSYATDLLSYNLNASVLETIPVSVIREQNFRNIAKTYDFTLKGASPSSGLLEITLDPGGTYPGTITKHVQFTDASGIIFQPDGDTAVAAYSPTPFTIEATQGKEVFEEAVATSDGSPGQAYQLQQKTLLDGTLEVAVNGTVYDFAANAVAAGPTDKIYFLSIDESGIATIQFGDGLNGIIPPGGQAITATYKVGGGLETNLPPDQITQVSGTSDGSSIPDIILSVTNPDTMTGGGPKQSLANAKIAMPAAAKSNERCVSLEDFAAEALKVNGVLKAKGIPGPFSGGSIPVLLLVVPNGGGTPSSTLSNAIQVALKDKKLAGKRITVSSAVYVDLIIEAEVFVQKSSVAAVVGNRVQAVYLDKYSMENVDFEATFALQDAYDSVAPETVTGVSRVFLRKFTVRPYFGRHVQQPTVGTGSVIGISTEANAKRREWFITMTVPDFGFTCTMYNVKQRRLGTITSISDTLLTDDAADYEANELVGFDLHPRPDNISTTFAITGNTTQSIACSGGGLLTVAQPGDPYSVEDTETTHGKILATSPTTTASAAQPTILVGSGTTDWTVGDPVYIVDGANTQVSRVNSINPGVSITLDDNLDFNLSTSGSIYYLWRSDDESVQFAVVNATGSGQVAFAPGDHLYVDTFQDVGDVQLRPENFPTLVPADLLVTTVGGVR